MATNKIYATAGTPLTFKASGGSAVMTLDALDHGVGRISAQYDRGAGSLPMRYRCRATFVMEGTHATVAGDVFEIYLCTSDGTNIDGTMGASDAALTTDKRRNLQFIGCVVVDVAATAETVFTASFEIAIYERYVSIGVWNATTDITKDTANGSLVVLTPYSDDIQAAA